MTNTKKIIFILPLLLVLGLGLTIGLNSQALQAQDKKIIIQKASELPRRSLEFKGSAQEIFRDDAQLHRLNQKFIENLESDLEKYDIQDKATLKSYYQTLMMSYYFENNYEKALSFIPKFQALCDKEAEKLSIGSSIRAFVAAKAKYSDVQSPEFQKLFAENYAKIWNDMPYEVVKDEVESNRGQLSIFNPELSTASLDNQIQTYLDNNKNVVPEGLIASFINLRILTDRLTPLIDEMLAVMNQLYEANKSTQVLKNIWEDRDISLSPQDNAQSVNIAIWDSGVDLSVFPTEQHFKDSQGKSGLGYSLIDYQKDGLLLESPKGKIKSEPKSLQSLTKGMMDIRAAVNSPEAAQMRKVLANLKKEELKSFQEELAFYGNYAHGTHVAGIALKGNPFARIMPIRMGFDYRSTPPAHSLENARFQANMYQEIVQYLKKNKVRVVNMSWRYGASAYEGLLALNGIGKDEEERKAMAQEMFNIEKKALYEAFQSAPEILFVCGSGNENNDAGFVEYIPAGFVDLPNLITIGAVDSEGKKTSFTTEGESVKLYANGFEVESFVPGGAKIKFSGTSMASPQVVNLAAKLLAYNPSLSPQKLIELINQGSDALEEDPRLRLINPKKTLALLKGENSGDPSLEQLLQRKWRPHESSIPSMLEDVIEGLRTQDPAQAEALAEQSEMIKQVLRQVTIEFKANGEVETLIPGNPSQVEQWKLKEDMKTIIREDAEGSKETKILELSTEKLLTKNEDGKERLYVPAE